MAMRQDESSICTIFITLCTTDTTLRMMKREGGVSAERINNIFQIFILENCK